MTLYSLSIDGRHVSRFAAETVTDAARHVAERYDAQGAAVLIESVPDALEQIAGESDRAGAPMHNFRARLARLGFTVPPVMPLTDTAEVYRRAAASEGTDAAHRPIMARIAELIDRYR